MNPQTILIVDDSDLNRKILHNALSENYNILEAANGIEALDIINKNNDISLVILDIMMPKLNGIEVLKIMKSKKETISIPVVLITASDSNEEYAFELGAVDFIPKPFKVKVVKSRVNTQIELKNLKDNKNEKYILEDTLYTELSELVLSSVLFGNRHNFSNMFKKNRAAVSLYMEKLINKNLFKNDKPAISETDIINSICFRDIGKIFIRDEILLKPDLLTKEEFEAIKTHTNLSNKFFEKIPKNLDTPLLKLITDICYFHHENYDGSGYPFGLESTSIPFCARVAAIFDCYEAIITEKPYRKAHTHKYAIDFINENKGTKFDPELADAFVSISDEIEKIYS